MHIFLTELTATNWLWKNPDEFLRVVGNSIETQTQLLHDKIKEIEAEIEEIGKLLVTLPKDFVSRNKKSRVTLKDFIEVDKRMLLLKNFYALHLYDACERCILVSLNKLAEACGYKLHMVMNRDEEFVHKLFPEDSMVLRREASFMSEIVRLKSFDDLVVASAKRRASLLSTISKANWSDERKLESAYLK